MSTDPINSLLSRSPSSSSLFNLPPTTLETARDILRLIPLKVGKIGSCGKQDSMTARAGIAIVIAAASGEGGGVEEGEVAKLCMVKKTEFAK